MLSARFLHDEFMTWSVFADINRPKKNPEEIILRDLFERLAATYSRGSYTTTTIGHAAFDSRVRKGNGSGHCGNATKLISTLLDVQNCYVKIMPDAGRIL